MTQSQFKRIAQLLKDAYKEVRDEAVKEGMAITSPEYEQVINTVRERILEKEGFSVEEYESAKAELESQRVEKTRKYDALIEGVEKIRGDQGIQGEKGDKGDKGEQGEVGPRGAKGEKGERGERGPKGEKGEKGDKGKDGRDGKDGHKGKDAKFDPVIYSNLKKDFLKQVEGYVTKEEAETIFGQLFEHNINILGMPDFRKLSMGLQDQIDHRVVGVSDNQTVPKITVSATEPANPKLYDLWVDIS